jgi:hypothetical protein
MPGLFCKNGPEQIKAVVPNGSRNIIALNICLYLCPGCPYLCFPVFSVVIIMWSIKSTPKYMDFTPCMMYRPYVEAGNGIQFLQIIDGGLFYICGG